MAARWLGALFLLASVAAFAQSDDLAVGKFLVASRDLGDPNFAHSVILLVQYDADQGSVGLIVNRRTDVPLSRVFQDMKEAKDRKDPVYIGGPVELDSVLALVKSPAKGQDAKHIFGNVYLVSTKGALKAVLASHADASHFHTFVGYAGWGGGQLEDEVKLGAWHIMQADATSVFQSDPDALWDRLISQTELNVVRLIYTPPLR